MLLGEDCAHEPDHSSAIRKDAHYIGAPADFLVEKLLGVVGPDLMAVLFGEADEGQNLRRCLGQHDRRSREALFKLLDHPGMLGAKLPFHPAA